MISGLLARIRAIFQDPAEFRYFAASDAAGHALDRLGTSHRCHDRVIALLDLAEAEQTMAENAHTFADADAEDNFTLAQTHAMAARLARLVVGTELASENRKRIPLFPGEPLAEIARPILYELAMVRMQSIAHSTLSRCTRPSSARRADRPARCWRPSPSATASWRA